MKRNSAPDLRAKGICAGALLVLMAMTSGAHAEEIYSVFPFADMGKKTYPLIERDKGAAVKIEFLNGASGRGEDLVLEAGGKLRILQGEKDELRFNFPKESSKNLSFAERRGALSSPLIDIFPSREGGIIPVSADPRWIEVTAKEQSSFKVRTIQYEETSPLSERRFRPMALKDAEEFRLVKADSTEETFYHLDKEAKFNVSKGTLLKISLRSDLQSLSKTQRPLCSLRYQTVPKQGEPDFSIREGLSSPSPFEWVEAKGKKRGVGQSYSYYIAAEVEENVRLFSNCLISVATLTTVGEDQQLQNAQDKLKKVLESSNLDPLGIYMKLSNLQVAESSYLSMTSFARSLSLDALYYRNLYPLNLSKDDTIERMRGNIRTGIDDRDLGPGPALIPSELRTSCLCVTRSDAQHKVEFLNPEFGHRSMGRLIISEGKPLKAGSYRLSSLSESGESLQKFNFSIDETRNSNESFFTAFLFRSHPKAKSFVVTALADSKQLPTFGLEILSAKEQGFDRADLEEQLHRPKDIVMHAVATEKPDAFDRRYKSKMLPLLRDLKRASHNLDMKTDSSARLSPRALESAIKVLETEGSYSLMKDICISALAQKAELRPLAEQCLKNAFSKTEDYRGLAWLLSTQYRRSPSSDQACDFARAISSSGHFAEAIMVASEAAIHSDCGKTLLDQLWQTADQGRTVLSASRPQSTVRGYGAAEYITEIFNQEKVEAFSLIPKHTATIQNHDESPRAFEIEFRSASDKANRKVQWLDIQNSSKAYRLPLLFQGQSPDYAYNKDQTLSLPSKVYVYLNPSETLNLTVSDESLLFRVKTVIWPQLPPAHGARIYMFPKDPNDEGFMEGFSSIAELEEERKIQAANTMRGDMITKLRSGDPGNFANAQRLRILENNKHWVPITAENASAKVVREDYAAWSPDNPITQAQKSLLPKASDNIFTVVTNDEEDLTAIELSQAADVLLNFDYYDLDGRSSFPQKIEWKVDADPWQSLSLKKRNVSQAIKLSAGQHALSLRFKEQGSPRFLFVKAQAKVGDAWTDIRIQKSKYWSASTIDQPLVVNEAGLFRIHEKYKDRVSVKYRRVPTGGQLTLKSGEGRYFRLYALNSNRDDRPLFSNPALVEDLSQEDLAPPLELERTHRPIYKLDDGAAYTLELGTRSHCSGEDDRGKGICDHWWHPDLSLGMRKTLDSDVASLELALYPGVFPLGQLSMAYEFRPKSLTNWYKIEASGFYAKRNLSSEELDRNDNSNKSIQGGSLSLAAAYLARISLLDSLTEAKLRFFEVDRESTDENLPQAVVSPWKQQHRRSLMLSETFSFQPAPTHSVRLKLGGISNTPKQTQAWDQASVVLSWLQAWTPFVSTGLGYEVRYFFRDRNRSDYTLRFSPRLDLLAINYDALRWPILTRLGLGLEADSPRTIFALSFETPLGTRLNPDSEGLRDFPFSDLSRGEIFKRHVQ